MKNVTEYYEADHDRLDELFKNFQKNKRTDYPKAREFFVSFKFGLQRHIVWEEDVLFPAFEQKTGMTDSGPTQVMRLEHKEIGAHLEAIHQKVKAADPNSDREELNLLNVLGLHNQKEEEILYPFIDRALSAEEIESVFRKMNEIPEERYLACCQSA